MGYHLESIQYSRHHRARDEEFHELYIPVILASQEEKLVLRLVRGW
jgi:hypothetical protein